MLKIIFDDKSSIETPAFSDQHAEIATIERIGTVIAVEASGSCLREIQDVFICLPNIDSTGEEDDSKVTWFGDMAKMVVYNLVNETL